MSKNKGNHLRTDLVGAFKPVPRACTAALCDPVRAGPGVGRLCLQSFERLTRSSSSACKEGFDSRKKVEE